jgi:hypothetical protein
MQDLLICQDALNALLVVRYFLLLAPRKSTSDAPKL